MLCSVTVLGARNGADAAAAAGRVVDYLKGRQRDHGNPLRDTPRQPEPDADEDAPARYYGDSAEGTGRWLGSGFGAIHRTGAVDNDDFSRLLLGEDPTTGERLVGPAGSAARANGPTPSSAAIAALDPDAPVGLGEAARLLGVGRSYLPKLAKRTIEARSAGEEVPTTFLDARQAGPNRRWEVTGAELQRFAAVRESQAVVLGYDVTFSCPKSVSLLWAMADPATRTEILAAIDTSVTAGIAYLEEHGCTVKVGGDLVAGGGFQAAGFLHGTSRALDPQLHWHCVIANATTGPTGAYRAIDARGLFAHAKTAGYLAGAQLRHELTRRLGVAWTQPVNGLANIDGIDRDTIAAFSKRSSEIGEVADAAGLSSAAARQAVALSTRAAKHAVDTAELLDGWHQDLTERGYTPDRYHQLLDRDTIHAPTPGEVDELARRLLGPHGLTELASVFDRRDVLQAVAEWAGSRLTAEEIATTADQVLDRPEIITLGTTTAGRPGIAIQRGNGRRMPTAATALYTTAGMLELEARIVRRVNEGLDTGTGVVPNDAIDDAIRSQPSLGTDQQAMVRAICSSGDQVQCVLGPAGTGKTFALAVAARAWESQGTRVVGTAVAAVATDVLGRSLGIDTTTVAGLLTRLDTSGPAGILDNRTVVIVDEASTIGTRDLARLLSWTAETGAAVRLVGDPAQHSAVAAGGMFRHLIEVHPDRVPTLTENRRQAAPELADVRLALDDYRAGKITEALDRLDADQRVVTADTPDELLDALVADWYVDRQHALADPAVARSSMVAEHHFERRELNNRARALLEADGTLHGPALDAGGQRFQAGDEIICRTQDRTLRPAGGNRASYIRNGTRGTVTAVHHDPERPGLTVDFDGKGEVFVPRAFLQADIRPQVTGGLTHAYALTSHAAQGDTYQAGRHLATDHSSREGVYVGLTRGRTDVRLYTVNHRDLVPRIDDDPGLPRLEAATRAARDAVATRLATSTGERLATEHDTIGPDARHLAAHRSAAELHQAATTNPDDPTAVRAWNSRRLAIAAEARHRPSPEILDHLGPRPDTGAARHRWDHAAALLAEHHAIHPDLGTPEALDRWSQIEPTLAASLADRSQTPGPKPPKLPLPEVPTPAHSVGTTAIDLGIGL